LIVKTRPRYTTELPIVTSTWVVEPSGLSSCDNLRGFTDSGYKVNGEGVRAPAGLKASWPAMQYYTKTA
jgi:hypothetical protein